MKKTVSFLLILALTLTVIFGIVACDTTNGSISNPKLKKVDQAFDGVERSLNKTVSLDDISVQAYKELYLGAEDGSVGDTGAVPPSDPWTTIRNVYVAGDRQTISDPDLEYDQPPMQQFQYLKAIFKEMGNDYELGTKYYYDISGQVYLDMETGFAVDPTQVGDPASYRYDYVFGFAMSIELRKNDLIFAEVGFKITLTQGTAKYQTSWYVRFDLAYDFDEKTPTYTLAMYTDNKEGELPFLNRAQGYEYDYVQVNKGVIKEWRKFVMDADKEIVIDDTHSYDSFIAEGNACTTDTVKWLKDGNYYKLTQNDENKNRILTKAFVEGVGMNSTSIGGASFLEKEGKKNAVIDAYYQSICEIYGGDIIYDLVCKKEYNGGNDNGSSAHAWNSSVGTLVAAVSSLVPGFESATATFTAVTANEGVWITVSNATADDYTNFKESLERVGFNRTGEQDGAEIFLKTTDGGNILVAIDTARNYIGVSASSGNANNDAITMLHALPYTYGYIGYDKRQFGAAKDLSEIIEKISFGRIASNELGGLSANDSFLYDVTLPFDPALGMSMEKSAAETAAKYGADYKNDDTWTNMESNMLNYATIDGKEVLVLLASGTSEGAPHLYIYMLQFETGNIPQILETNGATGGNGNEGGPVGEDTKPNDDKPNGDTPTGEDEKPNGGNGNEGGASEQISVTVTLLDGSKNIALDGEKRYTFKEGQDVRVAQFIKEEGQKVYYDRDCTEKADDIVKAYPGLQLFVWKEVPKGVFTIYDVTDAGAEIWKQFDMDCGSGVYFGNSFERCLYWDAGCTRAVPLDYDFEMTKKGITVYRHIYDDVFVLNIKTYINEHFYMIDSSIHKKEKIYPAFAPKAGVIGDYIEDCYYGVSAEYYLGEGKDTMLTALSQLATSADTLTVSVYVTNKKHHVYTLNSGSAEVTKDYITLFGEFDAFNYAEGMGNRFDYKNMSAEYCTVSGNVITMHNVTKLKGPFNVYYAWQGKQLCVDPAYNECYYNNDSYQTFNGDIGPSKQFFTDVSCTSPIVLKDNGHGYGEYVVTGEALYTPVDYASIY